MANPLAETLIARYRATFTKTPEWAWEYEPSIPLIGEKFKPGRGLLVYASAENLTWMNGTDPPSYFREPDVWNRYRVQRDMDVRDSHDKFFPDIGIQPANDGGLFAAALFVSQRLGLPTADDPRELLETVVITNWCKFTIKIDTNVDYINNLKKLIDSLPFVVGELAELQPAVVLLPFQVWRKPVLQLAMRGASPHTRFVPIFQCNPRVTNNRLKSFDSQAKSLRRREADTALETWMANLVGFNDDNAWRYLAFLDERLAGGGQPKGCERGAD